MLYKEVKLYTEPRSEVEKVIESYSEMTSFQQDFICGLLKEKRPKKIVELGVSAGGTTVLIMNCLKKLCLNAEMYSVDLRTKWYKNEKYETGFVAKRFFENDEKDSYHFLLGDSIAAYIDQIGRDIEFLILDTAHSMSGELLDFIVCLPYLKDECIVVMHDTIENHLTCRDREIATKILFDIVRAEDKYYMREENVNVAGLANIAAFKVNEETRKGVRDYISALTISWGYMLDGKEKRIYEEAILTNYGKEYCQLFNRIERLQRNTYLHKQISEHFGKKIEYLKLQWENNDNVLLYGAGFYAGLYYQWGELNQLIIKGLVISDDQEKITNEKVELPVYFLSELPYKPSECMIIIAVDQKYQNLVLKNLINAGYYNVL